MIKTLMPIFGVVIAIGLYFVAIDPGIDEIRALQGEEEQYDQALTYAENLQSLLVDLESRYNSFSTEELDRLETFIPDSIDTVRLVLDVDTMATNYDARIQNVEVAESEQQTDETVVQGGAEPMTATPVDEPMTDPAADPSMDPAMTDPTMDVPGGGGIEPYGYTDLSFTVDLPYEDMLSFLQDLETSLRFVDVLRFEFDTAEEGDAVSYQVNVRTYWLK